MKKLFAIAACSLPLLIAPSVYAQTTPAPAADPGSSAAPAAPGAPGGEGATPAAPPMNSPAPAETAPGTSDSAAMTEAITGWSVKDKIMGKTVYNEKDEKVGEVSDVVLASDGKAAYFIVGAGGFLGMGAHDVAVPFEKINQADDKLILQGYTKEQLKALPQVKVAK
ncbi:PRC-barrel domain-containing protein [Pollutimonas bauzanensis]|uniref:Sporulation protein YlmC, PRC-barrel domain family n=1 Tax=Pollutimonas bauzanensis TaxID=658167 RepID=A0A1M5ZEN6_9BURK|nr:PRC-barrel domain-containing protein [Pollutimonas bauzanensis]SHI22651.1 Sporulation protein YlmC, PRC-barrel domain family [Pollutimonas bauzanensis]